MSTKTKSFLKSKTFWFNVVSGIVLVAQGLTGDYIPKDVLYVVIVTGNIILRFLSDTKLTK